ncbi:hypothetical protein JYG36_04955 [Pseudomonas sp. SORT22]|uniref:P-loop NTPase n=1 Tax=Pseudomonas sp. SORT22 TaxID=2813842 RepID=UPI001BCB511D|nr:hypothetical protein [Pseudomonas sp. SORT22]QVM97540.1 hypothetical protein JYG36_04955 [Pseudomonas sp. SORT22]
MENKVSEFCERLSREHTPNFLVLGQNCLSLGAESDVFLDSILKKYSDEHVVDGVGYNKIFNTRIRNDIESSRAWISDKANLLVTPTWLKYIAEFAWSGVATSTFDGSLNRAFRNEWREVQPITSPDLQPLDPRNQKNLHITYLYGSISRSERDHSSPFDWFELTLRAPAAIGLLQRLPEAITPLGTLVIEGYNPETDWLQSQQLYPILMSLEKGQAFLFSCGQQKITDPFLTRAIEEGKLSTFEQSLASVMARGIELGIIQPGTKFHSSSKDRTLTLGKTEVPLNENLWNTVSRFATILDSDLPVPYKSQSAEKRYSEFRKFLSESGTKPLWSAFSQNLPFERDCEATLVRAATTRLQGQMFNADPVIFHGQAGSGKTIAMASVALKIHNESKYAVVFIPRRSQKFNFADLDAFCQWAEESGFPASLIVWDGMQDLEQYDLLHQYLLGRGRKFVLLGSAYRNEVDERDGIKFIESPSLLTASEIPRFKNHLSSFEPTLGSSLEAFLDEGDPSFLVALYRLLPESRGQVRTGLNLEASAVTAAIRHNSEQLQPEVQSTNILALALTKAGALNNRISLPTEAKLIAGEWIYAEQELVGLILVPGKFGLQVPIEVLLRSMSRIAITNFHTILEGLDLFRWSEDSSNNLTIGVRHPLEASLIAQVRLGGPHAEVEYALKLLLNTRQNLTRSDNQEVQFATELIFNLGPKGPEGRMYAPYYLEIANALKQIRENNGVKSPRLMLQESSLLREAIVLNLIPEDDLPGRLHLLERAQTILSSAIDDVTLSRKTARLYGMLLNELASIFGTRAREYIRAEKDTGLVLDEFNQAQKIAMRARTLMPEDFYPIDVISWSTKDVLKHANLKEPDRIEIIAGIFNVFSLCEGNEIGFRDKEKLQKRRLEFSELLSDEDLREDSLRALAALGSTAGIYLQAIFIAGGLPPSDTTPDESTLEKHKRSIAYLDQHYDVIKLDPKCLYLYLRYWWSSESGLPFFPPERTAVPFNSKQWSKALEIIESLISLSENYSIPTLLYLQAICTWHLGYHDTANELWRELQRISDRVTGRRRVLKAYISSDADGLPKKYHGTVLWVSDDGGKGELFVEGIRQRVAFFPHDFKMDDIAKDEQISDFHIAFNYIAPTADPAYHYSANSGVKK